MDGFRRRGYVVREGDEPLVIDLTTKHLKASYKDLFEAQEHRRRPFPWAETETGKDLLAGIHVAMKAHEFELCYDHCVTLQETEGIDWPTVSNGALCLFMLGDVDEATRLWEWAAKDLEEHRRPEDLDESYMRLERPFSDREWSSVYATIKVNVGEVHWEKGRFGQAKVDLELAIAHTPTPETKLPRLMKLAQVELSVGNQRAALLIADQALQAARAASPSWVDLLNREIGALEDTLTGIRPLFSELLLDQPNSIFESEGTNGKK